MTAPVVLTWVAPGDVIDVTNPINGRTEPLMVVSACPSVVKGFHCVTCQMHLANAGNLVMHIEQGTHHVAVWCEKHRCYEAPEPGQATAFAAITGGSE